MNVQRATAGRILSFPLPALPRPALGGRRRPPPGGDGGRSEGIPLKRRSTSRHGHFRRGWRHAIATAVFALVALPCAGPSMAADNAAANLPNLAGTYRCEGYQLVCARGRTFTVTQQGARVDFKNELGDTGTAWLTSNITLSASGPWNMLGVLLQNQQGVIQWSNGTQWRKEQG